MAKLKCQTKLHCQNGQTKLHNQVVQATQVQTNLSRNCHTSCQQAIKTVNAENMEVQNEEENQDASKQLVKTFHHFPSQQSFQKYKSTLSN